MDASSAPGAGVPAPARPKKRTGTSKYDFIKVKVWLGEDLDHYYILSRFLICRMLTVTRIPYIKAVKIALETKKYLVDHNLHDVTQAKLEEVLFSIVRSKGFDEAYIDCYRMVTQFYQSRQPLVIIICGAAWTGKSTLAQQLASRINIPNVMQTDIIYELLRSGPDSPLHAAPLWARPGLAGGRCCDAALVREFRREARVVREGMEGDLIKTLSDGKPIIIEGFHLDPGLYIPDFGSRGLIMLPARPTAALTAAAAVAAGGGLHAAAAAGRSPGSSPLAGRGRYGRSQTLPQQRGTAAAVGGAGAVSVEQLHELTPQQQGEQAAGQLQQQQQHMMLGPSCKRSMSAAAEVSVSATGPLSPGSLAAPAGSSVSAETALALLRRGAAADTPQGQQQQQDWQQHQQPQRLLRVSEEPGQPQQQASSLPPLPPLRLRRQDVSTTQTNGHRQGNSPRSSSSSSTVQQPFLAPGAPSSVGVGSSSVQQQSMEGRQRMGTPFADAAAAAAGAAASVAGSTPVAQAAAAAAGGGDGGRDSNWPTDSLFSGPDELPVVMTGEEVQVCAAAAEAAALQQHRQEQQVHSQLQQQLAQQGRGGSLPDSPFSPASDASSFGVGGGSPCCISQEHSTTEVVSRVCSCASLGSPALILSQEASGVDVWSPAAAGTAAAAAAAAAAAGADGPGCGAAMCRQLSSGGLRAGGLRVRGSAGSGSGRYLQQLPEEQEACAAQQQQQQQQQQQEQQHGLPPAGGPDVRQLRPAAASAPASLCGGSAGQPQPVPAAAPDVPSQPASATRVSADSCVVHDTVEGQQQQQQRGEPEPVGKPLFVPILLYMDEPDHVLMADEALSHLGLPAAVGLRAGTAAGDSSAAAAAAAGGIGSVASDGSCMHAVGPGSEGGAQGGGGGVQGAVAQHQQQQQQGGAESVGEALRRVRLLQEYLCAYEAQGLPVVKVSYGAFGEALDKLHEYVLQCIKVAMQSQVAVLHQQHAV